MKTPAAQRIISRRPYVSAAGPAIAAPAIAPIGTAATTRPWAKLPRAKSCLMKSRAPAMIPVS